MTIAAETYTQRGRFTPYDWALLAAVALMWGSSFLLIKLGLQHFAPSTVAWLRLVFGAATLAVFPAARRPIPRADWPWVAVLGAVWMSGPFVLFPLAEQTIDSALAGMVNGAAPLFTVLIAVGWFRRLPGRTQLFGLLVGFAGVVAINWPAAHGATTSMVGADLVLLATVCYGIAFNLAEPLEARDGAPPVILRAQLVALTLQTVPGTIGLTRSTWASTSLLAMLALGALSTGLAFAAFATLVGRVGATRSSVTTYFVPVVAITLGILVGNETVAEISLAGTALVLVGAYLTSRQEHHPN